MTDLPVLKSLKCAYCEDVISHLVKECGSVVSRRNVEGLVLAHASRYHEKAEFIVRTQPTQRHNDAIREIAACDALLALIGKTAKELEED